MRLTHRCAEKNAHKIRALTLTFTGLLVLAAAFIGARAASEREMPSDTQITNAVLDRFLIDPGVGANAVDVSTVNGVTTLTGTVDNILEKERATEVARTVKGVRAVIDRVVVEAPDVPDDRLEDDVRFALSINPRTEAFEISVSANDGEVRLKGSVDSWRERDLVENVVSGVRGVKELDSNLIVRTTIRSEGEIREDVVGGLLWDRYIDDTLIDVDVNQRTVVLKGTVGSAAERQRAIRHAWVKGVEEVDADGLAVKFWARQDDLREDKYVAKSDQAIVNAVETALLLDPRVLAENVDVSVNEGVVTLRGDVDYLGASFAAAQAARNTVGALWVRNRLRVRPAEVWSDKEIVARLEKSWRQDPYLERDTLSAHSDDGEVRIEGTVDTSFERLRAEQLARDISGVVQVNNNVDVVRSAHLPYNPYLNQPFPYDAGWYSATTATVKSDREIASEVRDELWWSPFVDSDRVNVSVDGGTVTLTGTVDTWAERRAATENALEGGAVTVINELSVRYES